MGGVGEGRWGLCVDSEGWSMKVDHYAGFSYTTRCKVVLGSGDGWGKHSSIAPRTLMAFNPLGGISASASLYLI